MFFRVFCLILLLGLQTAAWAAPALALATLVDGEAVLVRQTSRLTLTPGVRLAAFDLIETAASTTLVRLEFADGTVADLGPDTRAMMAPSLAAGSRRRQAALYLLSGWVKLSASPAQPATTNALISAAFDLSGLSGNTVVLVQSRLSQIFVESGAATVTEINAGKSSSALPVKQGGYFSKGGSEKASLSARPPSVFLAEVPRAFLDPVPLRASAFKDRPEPAAKPLGRLAYAQAKPWLGAEMALRNTLVKLWQDSLDANLRTGLADNIQSHPEWRSVLFPDKISQ